MKKVIYKGHAFLIEEPNVCPHCHVINAPHFVWEILSKDTNDITTYLSAWRCSNSKCQKIFFSKHNLEDDKFIFDRFLNGLPKGPVWPKPILDLKSGNILDEDNKQQSKFIKTYLQSLRAENYGLDEIAGMGYRKAIEYLVKDWALQNNQDDDHKIKNMWLGAVIKEYFDGEIKEILERATWLGNDQSHYNKIFEEYDVDILKELIELIMVELDREYKKEHYIKTIQKKNT